MIRNPFCRPGARPVIYGHRGARGVLPENTMEGFHWLRAQGFKAVEIDVQLSADGVPVILHDPLLPPQLARDSQGNWLAEPGPNVTRLTAAELQAYDVGRLNPEHPYSARFPEQRAVDAARVPSLAGFLDWASADPAMILNIEIKSFADHPELGTPPARMVAALLQVMTRHGGANPVVVSSFDWNMLHELRRMAPEMALGYLSLARSGPDCTIYQGSPWMAGQSLAEYQFCLPRLVAAQGAQCWCPHYLDLTAEDLAQAHALGLAVNVWTVNDPTAIDRMVGLGVDGIITDYPLRALHRS